MKYKKRMYNGVLFTKWCKQNNVNYFSVMYHVQKLEKEGETDPIPKAIDLFINQKRRDYSALRAMNLPPEQFKRAYGALTRGYSMEQALAATPRSKYFVQGKPLFRFCNDNNLSRSDYYSILHKIKRKGESPEKCALEFLKKTSLIKNREFLTNWKNNPDSWKNLYK